MYPVALHLTESLSKLVNQLNREISQIANGPWKTMWSGKFLLFGVLQWLISRFNKKCLYFCSRAGLDTLSLTGAFLPTCGTEHNVCVSTFSSNGKGWEKDKTGLGQGDTGYPSIVEAAVGHRFASSFQKELQILTAVNGPSDMVARGKVYHLNQWLLHLTALAIGFSLSWRHFSLQIFNISYLMLEKNQLENVMN